MEEEDEDAIAVLRLRSWTLCMQGVTHAALSPSLARLLLLESPTGSARIVSLTGDVSAAPLPLGAPVSSSAWACRADCYTHSTHGDELLFTSGSSGVVIYKFSAAAATGHICDVDADLSFDAAGRPRLAFADQAESACVSMTIAYHSPCFSALVAFGGVSEEVSCTRFISSSANLLAMCLGDVVILLSSVDEVGVHWTARIILSADEAWVDFCFVFEHHLVGLTKGGKLFTWDALTGEQVESIILPDASASRLLPAHAQPRPLVGVADALGRRIFLVPLLQQQQQQKEACSWWQLADSDISASPSESPPSAAAPSAFTPKRLLGRACEEHGRKKSLIRQLQLSPSSSVAAIGSCAITTFILDGGRATLVQQGLYTDSPPHLATRTVSDHTLALPCHGSLYLISSTSLALVLPPFVDPSLTRAASPWWSTPCSSSTSSLLLPAPPLPSTRSLRRWQMDLLDRCLIYDGLTEAEYLFNQNGWSIRLARLRKLELALYYLRPDEVEPLLAMLVPVGAAEAGLIRVIFTSLNLMLNRFGTDNELALASRLLALAARFTRDLLKNHESGTDVSFDLARSLETIRVLQEDLHLRRKGPKTDKGDPGTEVTDKVEKRSQALSVSTALEESPLFSSGLVASEDEASSRRHPSQESSKEMISRWEKEKVDVSGIVKDALRAGRLPLAVVQLHHRRRESSSDEAGTKKLEADVFREVQDAGRSIVYELLCKGKMPLALAALRRLGEDIRTVLHDLAFGTVRRSLRCLTIRELRRHGQLDTTDFQLMSTVSRIEDAYPSSNFWISYNKRQQPRSSSTDLRQELQIYTPGGEFIVQCGEIDGVVFGSWSNISGKSVEDEVVKDETAGAYWAGALVWLQDLDQQTIDRMLLEQSPSTDVSWESKLMFSVVHHRWSNVSRLISEVRSDELEDMELKLTSDLNGDVVVIPQAKHLVLDLEACTGWLWTMIERVLARRFIFLRQSWTDAADVLSLFSHAGLIFDHIQTQDLLQLVATQCVKNNLPWLLELYLDKHSTMLTSAVHDSQWLQWLVSSRQQGSEYSAALANARTVLTSDVSTLDDVASSGSAFTALVTLVYAPASPQKCVYAGVKRPDAGKSWQCALQHFEQCLEHYPTLWKTLRSRCIGPSTTRRVGYLQWRKSLFSSANADTSLTRMLPTWIPKLLRKALHISMQGFHEESFSNPVSWEDSINKSVENELSRNNVQISSSKIEQYLLRGCPLAAFQYLLMLRAESGKTGSLSALEKSEEESLTMVMPLAIRNFKNVALTAACALLLELCGVNATVLRCNISVLQRIAQHATGEDLSSRLAELLSEEYMKKGPTGHVEEQLSALVLGHLEKATMEMVNATDGCGLWLKNGQSDGHQFRTSQMCMSSNWNLVTTFCKLHHLPHSTVYLSYLARDNDWVGFLAEAQAESCSLDVLLSVASKNFTDDRLQSHIITVLKSSSRSEKANRNEAFEKTVPSDLFSILAEAERSKAPGAELLAKARELSWPLLTVVASCFSDASPLACLAAWLEVTASRETSWLKVSDGAAQLVDGVGTAVDATNVTAHLKNHVPVYVRSSTSKRRRLVSSEVEDEFNASNLSTPDASSYPSQKESAVEGVHEFLSKMVAVLCEQQRFIPLLRAFELFLPASPLLHFIRFLRAFSQMRLSEASAHLADFSSLLKEEIQSRGARTSTTWISKAAIAGANAVLAACPSVYEKRCMLQLLAAADFGDGGVAAMTYRKQYWKIQLAEPLLRQGRTCSMVQTSDLEDEELLSELEKCGQWEEARSWARQLDLGQQESSYVHHVTEMQAEAMVTEWKELLWDVPEQRAALWRHCQALFTKHLFPPFKAGMFFLKHADDVEHHGLAVELHAVLLLALQWLSGSITGSPPVYPVHLLRELETRVWLLAVESEVLFKTSSSTSIASLRLGALNLESSFGMPNSGGSPVDRTATKIAAVDGHLKVFHSMHMELTDDLAAIRQAKPLQKDSGPKPKRRLVRRMYTGMEQNANDAGACVKAADEESASGWEEKVGEGEVERAILALVEVGQVSAARQLQLKLLPNRVPSELAFAETALSIAMLSSPSVKGSVRGSVLGASVMKTLNSLPNLKDLSSASPLQVMEALTGACREGCGRGHCRRVSAVAQLANFLDLPFFEAFQKQPTELLQLLSLKGQDALAEAKLLVSTHSINPASIARILAESFFKGLLAAHRGGYMDSSSSRSEEGPAPLLWRSSDFVLWSQLCPSEPELGHALMRLVISGHDMPHACEVELLILAHQFYDSSACLDGMDVLVALAATRVELYVAEADFAALARLVTGVSNFQALRFVLDLLIENGQLELLLKKRASTVEASKESSASVRGFRMAVLSALRHFNAHDLDAFGMVYTHFSMAHEMANLLESRGRKGLNHRFMWNDSEQNEELLEIMRFFVDASEVYAGIDCGNKTRWCCAQASLLSLQLRMPELMWLNLSETNARRLLVEQRRFQEAVIVAEAYSLNQPGEWVPVLWNQVLSPGWIEHFLKEFVASLPLRPSMLMELARIYRSEVSARGDHLDFSKWLTSGMPPEITKSFRCILRHVGDFRLRTQLTTLASGFPDLLDVCARILDKVPDTAGPLVLKRGHGQTYVPLM